jgi:hypothetical protein
MHSVGLGYWYLNFFLVGKHDLTYFEGHKVQNVTISPHVSLLFDLENSNIVIRLGTVNISTKFRPDRTSNIAAIWSPWNVSGLHGGRIHL